MTNLMNSAFIHIFLVLLRSGDRLNAGGMQYERGKNPQSSLYLRYEEPGKK